MVEGIPFVLDYDIELKIAKKRSDTKEDFIYSAYYVFTNFNNSISGLNNPYIKIRRDGNGYISLEVLMHQCIREVVDENIINNSKVNYPIIDIPFEGNLCGFDLKANNLDVKIKLLTSFIQNRFTGIPNDIQRWTSDKVSNAVSKIFHLGE